MVKYVSAMEQGAHKQKLVYVGIFPLTIYEMLEPSFMPNFKKMSNCKT